MLDRDQGLLRFDHHFSDRNALAFTYFIEKALTADPFAFGGSTVPGFGSTGEVRFYNYVLRDTHTFTANLVNDARAGFHRRAQPGVVPANHTTPASLGFSEVIPDDPANAGPPRFDIAGYSSFGNTIQGPQARFDNTWQYADTISWVKGRHSLKFGGDFRAYEQNQRFTFINNGYFIYDGSGTDNGLVDAIPGIASPLNDFIHGFVSTYVQNSSAAQGYRDKFGSLFFQDDWKVAPNFTLNLGVRWEYAAPLNELRGRAECVPSGTAVHSLPNRAGRLALSRRQRCFGFHLQRRLEQLRSPRWLCLGSVLQRQSQRARRIRAFLRRADQRADPAIPGRAAVRNSALHPVRHRYDSPVVQFTGEPDSPTVSVPHSAIRQPLRLHDIAPISLTVMDPKFATPYSQQWNLQVQYQFAPSWLASVSYVGTTGTKLLYRSEINPSVVTPTATTADTDARRIYNLGNPQDAAYGGAVFSGITNQSTAANSNFNSLQAELRTKQWRGLQMTHSYTWSHAIDNSSGLRINSTGNVYDRRFDRGNAEFDIRHNYVGSVIYDLPWMKDQRGVTGYILGGWSLSVIETIHSGLPFNISESSTGVDRCLCAGGGQRPDYIGGDVQFVDPRSNAFGKQNSYFNGTGGGSATAAANPYFRRVGSGNSAALGAGRYGNFARNVFHGPGAVNTDFGLTKRLRITEGQSLELSGEAFNLFNHTNFLNPVSTTGGNIGSASFGRITGALEPRLIQITARYQF